MIQEVVVPAPAEEWRALATADPTAMADHAPEWTDAGARWGWRNASRLYRLTDGTTVVLPLLHRGGTSPWTTWAASPPSGRGFGGLIGESGRRLDVVRAVLADLAAQRWVSVRVRPAPETGDLWARAAPAAAQVVERRAHVLDLRPGPDAILQAMRKSTRRAVRRHERDGLEVEVGEGGHLLDVYERLRQQSIRHWAAAQHEPLWLATRRAARRDPPERLVACAAALGSGFRVWVAQVHGRPVAANVVVSGPTTHAIRAATDRSPGTPGGVMQYLDWLAIEQACADGSTAINLGESGSSGSLSSYKEGLGAVAHDYAEIRLERVPITPVDARARSLVKRAIRFED